MALASITEAQTQLAANLGYVSENSLDKAKLYLEALLYLKFFRATASSSSPGSASFESLEPRIMAVQAFIEARTGGYPMFTRGRCV